LIACAPAAAQVPEPTPEADIDQAATPTEPVAMLDVSPDDWFYRHITSGLRFGIIRGAGEERFEPNRSVTHVEFITMLERLHETWSEPIGTSGVGGFYELYLDWAVKMGIIHGDEYGDLMPDSFITREQMAVIVHWYITTFDLWEYVRHERGAVPAHDYSEMSYWAQGAIDELRGTYLATVNPEFPRYYFRPQDYAIRAEALAILTSMAARIRLMALFNIQPTPGMGYAGYIFQLVEGAVIPEGEHRGVRLIHTNLNMFVARSLEDIINFIDPEFIMYIEPDYVNARRPLISIE